MKVPALRDEFFFMTRTGATRFPLVPRTMHNRGNFIISLGQLTPWLAQQAETLGVDVFAGFAAAAQVFDDAGGVKGVRIGDMGVQRDGTPGPNYAPGAHIHASVTLIAEGARGSLAKELIRRFELSAGHAPRRSAWASRSFGSCLRDACSQASSSTPSAGRSIGAPTAAASSITSTTTGFTSAM